jgi:hypothetical protein
MYLVDETVMLLSFLKHAVETCLNMDPIYTDCALVIQFCQLLEGEFNWNVYFINQYVAETLTIWQRLMLEWEEDTYYE